ncbi:hypothetical protein FE257_006586 [Aspergillus nanangensis]|uniref:Zn(2)-C6 fungal-type domain-containing protein n=1 Tax=Aspergillus nanangensis TaxID=2582783 RepID=A0AAD4CYA4_ASPNN|nr:hypothetical protein FE257_006586 [Aspergillus nanangensis]
MASAGNGLVSLSTDLGLSVSSSGREPITDASGPGGNTTPQGETPKESVQADDSGVPTPTSAALSTPRALGSDSNPPDEVVVKKPRRVRTGCLTCRERHLKCDEARNQCRNCRKSGRICRRGVRLNFIDTQVSAPHFYINPPHGARVQFRDESRHIASEYVGGFERYPPPEAEILLESDDQANPTMYAGFNMSAMPSFIPEIPMALPGHIEATLDSHRHPIIQPLERNARDVPFHSAMQGRVDSNQYACLDNPDEMFLLQVFVEEFTHILPCHALEEPMLLKALMACGARHIFLVNPSYGEEKAAYLHDTASSDLLRSLQDPNRDSALCATTAVILNVYELMCSRSILPGQSLNHIAGARALIKECQWDARAQGLGGACFWLNVGMELLTCLQYNWTLAWDPDTWGVDMNLDQTKPSVAGNEELWTHWMLYICAKVANFRSSIIHFSEIDHPTGSMHINEQYQEWCTYHDWCERWAAAAPRSMKPLGHLHNWQTNSKTVFPHIWLIKRSSIVARLFYHTAQILLSKTHPFESEFSPEMHSMQQRHAHDICGIVSNVKDRGIASLSLRFIAIAAECLATRDAQEEIIGLLDNIIKETGWKAGHIKDELQQAWGWHVTHRQQAISSDANAFDFLHDHSTLDPSAVPDPNKMPHGIINPVMASADFSMENRPYREYYVAPQHGLSHYQPKGF